ncbi:uncharacterized protein LOC143356924 isoform X2 [Halictus rubicundus]|uniref:uncharacterized protein LOC143356924 isoform X2 n=1 Tax=Halictus rubicundus TaxID=77578 RepID=UPI0040369963
MSEENEHTSEENEAEMNGGNHSGEQSKSDNSMLNNETGQPLLEDEEMPTYISVSTPSRREDWDVNNTKQQDRIPLEEDHSRSAYPSDDQGGGSVYVVSSGEESNHPYNDEEEDDYADSEEDEEDEDEEDDDDENHLRLHHPDDDEDIETEYDQDCYDRASDDFILNSRLKQHHKERSLSLQDLSFTKNNIHSPYNNKKRHSINLFGQNYLGLQQNSIAYNVAHKRQSLPLKYQHVESKVKRYIRDIKEQSRKSMEKRIKEQEYIANKNHEENENETDPLKPTVTNKVIKDYAEKAIKDLQREENNEHGNSIYNSAQILENGGNNKLDIKVTENQLKHIRRNSDMNAFGDIQNEKRAQNCNDKLEKRNGSVDVNAHHIEYQNTLDRNVKFNNMDQPSLVNGHQQALTLSGLRSLSHEEYSAIAEFEQKEETIEQRHKTQEKIIEPETYNDTEMVNVQDMENSNTGCPLKIANVKSIRIIQEEQENFTKTNLAETVEVIQLKAQLNQKDAQFNSLRNAYQKTLAENVKMKQELDTLRKSLAKYESESIACETKIASVQTESVAEPVSVPKVTVTAGDTNNKVSTSSVASTVSSLDQWADSAASPAISIKPPDLTPILNSDDSLVLTDGTPRKLPHPLSRTFITSSRILQTLSNITQGKTSKMESPLVRNNKKRVNESSMDQLLNLEYNRYSTNVSTSKKRKATEMLGTSTFIQPFKIPHTAPESEKKSANTSNADLKYSEEQSNVKPEQQSMNKDREDPSSMDIEIEEAANQDDGDVKFFVYRDNENSKNKSFLIQAEEPTKDMLENEKNRIQECGPYLLGNLEVRMSEINGTISVWGKEINEESTSDNEDDIEVSVKSINKRTSLYSQKSPQIRFNGSPLVCSTQKKLKLPLRLNKSNDTPCCHSMSSNIVKSPCLLDEANDKRFESNHTNASNCSPPFGNSDSMKHRREWLSFKASSSSQEKPHSCCTHHAEFVDKDCNCGSYHERQMCDDSPNHSKDKFHVKGIRRSSYKNAFTSETSKHLRENISNPEIGEVVCKYNKSCRHSMQNVSNSCSHSTKCCNGIRDVACTCKSSSSNVHNHDCFEKQSCSHSSSHDGEEEPLIPPKRSNETLETRQRRLSGKRVRGILMDLLKGCGDCRNTNGNTVNKGGLQLKESVYMKNGPPQIKISSCPTPEPSHSSSTQCNERCCHAYARRIESQLEEFRTEMERVRSRSDAILDMLNMLHSVDMN